MLLLSSWRNWHLKELASGKNPCFVNTYITKTLRSLQLVTLSKLNSRATLRANGSDVIFLLSVHFRTNNEKELVKTGFPPDGDNTHTSTESWRK